MSHESNRNEFATSRRGPMSDLASTPRYSGYPTVNTFPARLILTRPLNVPGTSNGNRAGAARWPVHIAVGGILAKRLGVRESPPALQRCYGSRNCAATAFYRNG